MKHARLLFLDGLGILLLLVSPFLGVLPGPGGAFVFAAGLWLLARNHGWAKRLLETIKQKGMNLIDIFFVEHPLWEAIYDFVAIVLIIIGIYILDERSGTIPIIFGSFLNLFGLSLVLGNRKRIQRLTTTLTKLFDKKPKK